MKLYNMFIKFCNILPKGMFHGKLHRFQIVIVE